jgi:CheY-like chemotaxis protein
MRLDTFVHVVLVEDSDEDADTAEEALRRTLLPVRMQRVTSGEACLALLTGVAGLLPSLVVMDLGTPGLDGRDALREIRRDPRLSGVVVVVMSTSNNPRDVDFCYHAGANAYHVKPVHHIDHLQAMTALFEYWLRRVELAMPQPCPRSAPA